MRDIIVFEFCCYIGLFSGRLQACSLVDALGMENGRFEPSEDLGTCQAKTSGWGRTIIRVLGDKQEKRLILAIERRGIQSVSLNIP
jgi:hypothetical protein